MSGIQVNVLRAATAVMIVADGLKAGAADPQTFLQHLLDGVALLGRGSMNLSLMRRQLMKLSLGTYQELC